MYCTVEDFKSAGMGGEHTDAEIEMAIKRACAKIDTWTGLCFKPILKTYSFSGHGGETLHLDLDIISIESLLIDGYEVLPGDVRIVQNGLAPVLRERLEQGEVQYSPYLEGSRQGHGRRGNTGSNRRGGHATRGASLCR